MNGRAPTPDTSLTHTIFSDKIALGVPNQGGGFRNFLPLDKRLALAYSRPRSSTTSALLQYGAGHAYYDWVACSSPAAWHCRPGARSACTAARPNQLLHPTCRNRVAAGRRSKTLAAGAIGPYAAPNIYDGAERELVGVLDAGPRRQSAN